MDILCLTCFLLLLYYDNYVGACVDEVMYSSFSCACVQRKVYASTWLRSRVKSASQETQTRQAKKKQGRLMTSYNV